MNYNFDSYLIDFVNSNDYNKVKFVFERCLILNKDYSDNEGRNALIVAAAFDDEAFDDDYDMIDINMIMLLLNNDVDKNLQDINGNTPLIIACDNETVDINTIKLLLFSKNNIKFNVQNYINIQNKYGNTALHCCLAFHHFECAKFLINNGADVGLKDTVDGETVLHFVCKDTYPISLIKLIIKNSTNINCKDNRGYTPLYYAIYYGLVDTVKLLLQNKDTINIY